MKCLHFNYSITEQSTKEKPKEVQHQISQKEPQQQKSNGTDKV